MEVLVCVKRVPAPGAKVPLTEDAQDIDTRHLGFTIGPHEECAVEEAVRLVEANGGRVTVLAAGPPEVAEQLRYALAMGADRGVLVDTGAPAGCPARSNEARAEPCPSDRSGAHAPSSRTDDAEQSGLIDTELDPEATAAAIVHAIRTLDARPFDLILFGNESADAGHYQVGIRVACELGLPIVGGIKGIEVDGDRLRLRRDVATGVEVYEVPLPTAAAVKEGLNLPRYPTMPGRLKARKAQLRTIPFEPAAGGLRKLRLRQPRDDREAAIVLGHGAAAAPAVVDVLEELGAV